MYSQKLGVWGHIQTAGERGQVAISGPTQGDHICTPGSTQRGAGKIAETANNSNIGCRWDVWIA